MSWILRARRTIDDALRQLGVTENTLSASARRELDEAVPRSAKVAPRKPGRSLLAADLFQTHSMQDRLEAGLRVQCVKGRIDLDKRHEERLLFESPLDVVK